MWGVTLKWWIQVNPACTSSYQSNSLEIPHYRKTFILVFNEALWMREKLYHTLVNPNQMHYHCINVQDNPSMHKPMGITCIQEDVNIPLYMSGTMFCADNSSPTQQQLDNCPWIIQTYQHDWDPHSVRFKKVSHTKEEEYLFAGFVAIRVDALHRKVYETNIEPGLCVTVQNPSFIDTRLVSQVIIADAKFSDATRINNTDEDVFEGQHQDIPCHRTLTSKERHLYVNPYDLNERYQIWLDASTKELKVTAQRMIWSAIMTIFRRYWADRMFGNHVSKGQSVQTQWQVGISPLMETAMHKYSLTNNYLLPKTPIKTIVSQDKDWGISSDIFGLWTA